MSDNKSLDKKQKGRVAHRVTPVPDILRLTTVL